MRDEVEKKARGYKDKRSKVRPDGSESLYGKDWTKRKAELWARCDGRCEQLVGWGDKASLERCRSEAMHPHHVIKRSKKRDDRLSNLLGICALHHSLAHPEKNKLHRRPNAQTFVSP
jgi:hypothetical protein